MTQEDMKLVASAMAETLDDGARHNMFHGMAMARFTHILADKMAEADPEFDRRAWIDICCAEALSIFRA